MIIKLVVALVLWVYCALSGEFGVNLSFKERDVQCLGVGLFSLPLSWMELSGRAEANLRSLQLRRLTLRGKFPWEESFAEISGTLSGTGRIDLSTGWEFTRNLDFGLVMFSGQAGVAAMASGILSGPTYLGTFWAGGRVELPPFWLEVRGEIPWPGKPRETLSLGLSGDSWITLRLDLLAVTPLSLVLGYGAQHGALSAQSFISLFPKPSQTITIRLGEDALSGHVRLSIRASEGWRMNFILSAECTGRKTSVDIEFSRGGLVEAAAEASFSFPL